MQVMHLMSFRERAGEGVWGGGGKQKRRARGWIRIGKNRWIGEEGKLEENVHVTSLHTNVSVFPKNKQ